MKGMIVAIISERIRFCPPNSMIRPLSLGANPVIPIMLTRMLTETRTGTNLDRLVPPSSKAFKITEKEFLKLAFFRFNAEKLECRQCYPRNPHTLRVSLWL